MTLQAKLGSLTMAMALTLLVGSSAYAKGDKLSKDDKKWLEEEVAALITTEEIEIFKDLKSKDRKLFKEIFWARRDPDPMTPKNEFIDDYQARVKAADENITNVGVKGSRSDMGHIAILLGSPAENNREGQLVTWRYDPNPALGIPDGLTVRFRDMGMGLRRVGSDDVDATLERVKTFYLMNRSVIYSRDEDGRLLKPDAQFDPNSPAKKLLQEMIDTQTENPAIPFEARTFFFRAEEGAVYVPILFEINAEALTWKKDKAEATIFGAVQNAEGQSLFPFEQPVELENKDGIATYEMPIQVGPGSYTFLFGVLDKESNTVGTRIFPVEVPDFDSDEMTMSSLVVYSEGQKSEDVAGTPGHAFQFGQVHFVQMPGDIVTYSPSDFVGIFFFVYGAGLDEGGEPNLTAQYVFFKDGKRRGQTAPEALQGDANQAVGNVEIPLANFEPGNYKIQVKVIDKVTKERISGEFEFVVEGASE